MCGRFNREEAAHTTEGTSKTAVMSSITMEEEEEELGLEDLGSWSEDEVEAGDPTVLADLDRDIALQVGIILLTYLFTLP